MQLTTVSMGHRLTSPIAPCPGSSCRWAWVFLCLVLPEWVHRFLEEPDKRIRGLCVDLLNYFLFFIWYRTTNRYITLKQRISCKPLFLYNHFSMFIIGCWYRFDAYMQFYLLCSFLTRITTILAAVIALAFVGILIFTYSYKRKKWHHCSTTWNSCQVNKKLGLCSWFSCRKDSALLISPSWLHLC